MKKTRGYAAWIEATAKPATKIDKTKAKAKAAAKKPAAPKPAAAKPAAKPAAPVGLVFATMHKAAGQRTVAMLGQVRKAEGALVVRQVVALPANLVRRLRDSRDCDGAWSSSIGALALWALGELDRQGLRLEIREANDVHIA